MLIGILFTILTGLGFLIGILSFQNSRKREKFSLFTLALAFVVLIGLLIFDLLPELLETKNILLIFPLMLGFLLSIFLDKIIPHHHHEHTEEHCDKKDHVMHLNHIGVVTIISMSIHNLLEGLSLYTVTSKDILAGVMMMVSILLHNIPMGFQIGNAIKDKKKNIFLIIFLCSSSLLGALLIILFGNINSVLENSLLAITFGMLLYILIFELFNEIRLSLKKTEVIYGIIIGVIILFVTYLL